MLRKRILFTSLVFATVCYPVKAYAWWNIGHMVTAQIAYDRLQPATKKEADRLIRYLSDAEPRVGEFVPAATWMDDIHGKGMRTFQEWHYINTPYNPFGLPTVAGAKDWNIIRGVEEAVEILKDKRAGDFQKGLMLRFLIHMVGDIHQPMHAVTRFTPEYPDGDRGGNRFPLALDPQNNLHKFWDSGGGVFENVSEQEVPAAASAIVKLVPSTSYSSAQLAYAPQSWARESYQLAVGVAYQDIQEGKVPSPIYQTKARQVIRDRLALGGYRLGALLNEILK